MKWDIESDFKNPNHGDTRVVTRFALLPIYAGGVIAWLQFVKIRQTYSCNYADDGWHNDYFV